ncbi:MAG: class I SAM-dependent methyltransferase [Caldilineaceae bacterium]
MQDSTKRFSSRVENYAKYRPSYPPNVIDTLHNECQLTPASRVADIGSGTGILTKLFLAYGNTVFAVEPNLDMRQAAELLLINYTNFSSINGTAEATTLADHSVDFVTAGQAFHWFDPVRTRLEFQRILRADGWVMLIWNTRQVAGLPFMEGYEALLLAHSAEYPEVGCQRADMDDSAIQDFYGPAGCKIVTLPNSQRFDYEGLKGRLRSSSYSPEPGHPQYEPMMDALQTLFAEHQVDGMVTFSYETKIFMGQLR